MAEKNLSWLSRVCERPRVKSAVMYIHPPCPCLICLFHPMSLRDNSLSFFLFGNLVEIFSLVLLQQLSLVVNLHHRTVDSGLLIFYAMFPMQGTNIIILDSKELVFTFAYKLLSFRSITQRVHLGKKKLRV